MQTNSYIGKKVIAFYRLRIPPLTFHKTIKFLFIIHPKCCICVQIINNIGFSINCADFKELFANAVFIMKIYSEFFTNTVEFSENKSKIKVFF